MNQTRDITLMLNHFAANCSFSFSNLMMQSPLRYTMMERRFLYKLSEEIKRRYTKMGLAVKDNWDNLVFHMTDEDIACVGGKNNWKRTYHVVRQLADRTVIQYTRNEKGELILGYFHWIDSFNWNTSTNKYTVRVSPELYSYVINLTKEFTILDLHTAIRLESKYSQKFYEFCCQYSGTFRYSDPDNPNTYFKQRVVKINITVFRFMFGLSELHDPKSGELIAKAKYQRFQQIINKVIVPAQQELYELYRKGLCSVWFDYYATDCPNSKSSPTTLYFFIYSKKHPKSKEAALDRPWEEGDEPLIPFEDKKPKTKKTRLCITDWKKMPADSQRDYILRYIKSYLKPEEVGYYIRKIDEAQSKCKDSYAQVIQVLYEKQQQEKYIRGTLAYKHKSLIDFVFNENLKEFGWNIPPMKKEQYKEPLLFSTN